MDNLDLAIMILFGIDVCLMLLAAPLVLCAIFFMI